MATWNKPEHMDQVVFDKFLLWDIDDTEKEKILNCCTQAQDETAFGEAFDEACLEFRLSGDDYPLANDLKAGHVKSRQRVIDRLQEMTPWSRTFIETILLKIAHPDTVVSQTGLEELFGPFQDYGEEADAQADPKYLSPYPPWLFFLTEKPETPYDLNTECLPARLALPDFDKNVKNFIGFEISSTKVNNPSKSTIADAGYNCTKNYWSPGGNTKPLSHCEECETSSGLNEIVCEPILVNDLELSLEIIEI